MHETVLLWITFFILVDEIKIAKLNSLKWCTILQIFFLLDCKPFFEVFRLFYLYNFIFYEAYWVAKTRKGRQIFKT